MKSDRCVGDRMCYFPFLMLKVDFSDFIDDLMGIIFISIFLSVVLLK